MNLIDVHTHFFPDDMKSNKIKYCKKVLSLRSETEGHHTDAAADHWPRTDQLLADG